MKKYFFLIVIFTAFLISCKTGVKKASIDQGNAMFQKLSDDFISGYLDWRPEYSVSLGFHQYDGKISDYTSKSIENELNRLIKYNQLLSNFDTATLSPRMYYDFQILQNAINSELFDFREMESYTKNPMTYAGAMDISIYIKRNFAPLEDRVKDIIKVEKQAAQLFRAAKANLADSLPKPYIEVAIEIANGYVDYLNGDVLKALKDLNNESLRAEFKVVNNNAIAQLKSFSTFLKNEKLPRALNNYALGEKKYQKMLLDEEDIAMSPDKILEIGLSELEKEKETFDAMAKIIDPKKKPVAVFVDIAKEHPTSENLIADVKKNLESIRKFIIDKNIVTFLTGIRPVVKVTPEYARSMSTASMDGAMAFETKATESYYYVTPVDQAWTSLQKEDWLRMFNKYTTDIVSIHEVYPGHFTQYLTLKASPATKLEKIFSSYAFVEGWAHYSERMMIDEGFGKSGGAVEQAKYHLAQSSESLLRLSRLCVSIQMHCRGMSVKNATRFFLENAYLGEKPANQEALRGTFDPGYLYYTLGKLMIFKLRKDYKKQEGANFSLNKFHNLILDHGMPQIPVLRKYLLKDKKIWNDIL